MSTLGKLPGWTRRIDEMSEHFTEAGLHGLLDNHAVTNFLGELLARGQLKPKDLEVWVKACSENVSTPSGTNPVRGEQAFWTRAWKEILGRDIKVPPPPKLKGKTIEAIKQYGFRLIFLPKITEADYPSSFEKLAWERRVYVNIRIQHRDLPGRWVAVETIAKPDRIEPEGYSNRNDLLIRALDLKTRFRISRNDLRVSHLPRAAHLLGLSPRAVRLPSAEEWNLIGNLFLWLNRIRNEALPNLGSTDVWEWCENSIRPFDLDLSLVVGGSRGGGLSGMDDRSSNNDVDQVGFRVLAVL